MKTLVLCSFFLFLSSFQIEALVVPPTFNNTSEYILDVFKGPCNAEKPVDCGTFCCPLNYRYDFVHFKLCWLIFPSTDVVHCWSMEWFWMLVLKMVEFVLHLTACVVKNDQHNYKKSKKILIWIKKTWKNIMKNHKKGDNST